MLTVFIQICMNIIIECTQMNFYMLSPTTSLVEEKLYNFNLNILLQYIQYTIIISFHHDIDEMVMRNGKSKWKKENKQ